MIDPRLLRDNPDLIRAAQAKRGLSAAVVDEALEADEARRSAIAEFERLRSDQKALGKLIPQAQGEEKQDLLARTKALATDVKAAEAAQAQAEDHWDNTRAARSAIQPLAIPPRSMRSSLGNQIRFSSGSRRISLKRIRFTWTESRTGPDPFARISSIDRS